MKNAFYFNIFKGKPTKTSDSPKKISIPWKMYGFNDSTNATVWIFLPRYWTKRIKFLHNHIQFCRSGENFRTRNNLFLILQIIWTKFNYDSFDRCFHNALCMDWLFCNWKGLSRTGSKSDKCCISHGNYCVHLWYTLLLNLANYKDKSILLKTTEFWNILVDTWYLNLHTTYISHQTRDIHKLQFFHKKFNKLLKQSSWLTNIIHPRSLFLPVMLY